MWTMLWSGDKHFVFANDGLIAIHVTQEQRDALIKGRLRPEDLALVPETEDAEIHPTRTYRTEEVAGHLRLVASRHERDEQVD